MGWRAILRSTWPLLLLGILAAGLLLYATPWGLGLGGDSYYYVSGARGLLAGQGFSRPAADGSIRLITHYPPGYSIMLAAITAMGLDTLVAARWLAAALFGVNVTLAGSLVYRVTRSVWPACLTALLVLATPALLVTHTWLLSEAMFLTITLLMLLALGRSAERATAWRVASAGALGSLAYLTRYVGLAMIAAGGLAMLLFSDGKWCRRLAAAIGFGVGAAVGPLLWSLRNLAVGGSVAYRAQAIHFPTMDRLYEAVETVSLWLLPSRVPSELRQALALITLLLLVALAIRILVRGPFHEARPGFAEQIGVLVSLMAAYPLTLAAAITIAGSSVPLDHRILSPLLVVLLILGVLVVWDLQQRAKSSRVPRIALTLAGVAFLALTLVRGAGTVRRLQADGQGGAARAWQESALVDWVRGRPAETAIFSNELDILYLYTGRQAYQVPIRWDPVWETEREDYPEQLARMREDILRRGAVLVLFDTIDGQQAFFAPREELTWGLTEWLRTDDGGVYGAPR